MQDSPLFVVDAHALWWYIGAPERLSPPAAAVFRLAETGNATLIVPAIALAELYYVAVKLRQPYTPSDLINKLEAIDGVRVSDLGKAQLELLDRLSAIPEKHDRLIAAEGVALGAPVITRDKAIADAPLVQVVW